MNAGPRSAQAYEDLKRLLLSGVIAPGERLDPARLAEELIAGVTPIREALLRLVGERLVEIRHNTGFHLPVLTETILVDLYRIHFELLRLALGSPAMKEAAFEVPAPALTYGDNAANLFLAIAAASQRPELISQLRTINDRLAATRTAEAQLFSDTADELKSINHEMDTPSINLTRSLRSYHSKRISVARLLVSATYGN